MSRKFEIIFNVFLVITLFILTMGLIHVSEIILQLPQLCILHPIPIIPYISISEGGRIWAAQGYKADYTAHPFPCREIQVNLFQLHFDA